MISEQTTTQVPTAESTHKSGSSLDTSTKTEQKAKELPKIDVKSEKGELLSDKTVALKFVLPGVVLIVMLLICLVVFCCRKGRDCGKSGRQLRKETPASTKNIDGKKYQRAPV